MQRRFRSPPLVAVGAYLAAALVGTLLLKLPVATTGEGLRLVDAFFLATSAVCVTGLSPVESLHDVLSETGFGLLLVLIQLGGMGLVLLGTLLFAAVGRRVSLGQWQALGETYAQASHVPAILRRVLLAFLILEVAGAVALYFCFAETESPWRLAIFHSVSAFCNAGFSNLPGGLMDYRAHVPVQCVMMFLIVCGGLGFRVLTELSGRSPVKRPRGTWLSLHSRLVLWSTAVLIGLGWLLFLALEWNAAALAGRPAGGKLLDGLFQSVTTRTAGFHTVDVGLLQPATLLIFCLWMVIGGSPASTAGGMKTVTLLLVLRGVWAQIRGQQEVRMFGRTIPALQIRKSMAVATVYLTTLLSVVFLLTLGTEHAGQGAWSFLELLFEACSALGTVGLSTGLTPLLPGPDKLLLVATMLVGRVGPLTLLLMVPRDTGSEKIRYPEEAVALG